MKNQLCGVLEAMEYLLFTGFTPAHDIYLALSGEEEIMGPTAASIRDLFVSRHITPAFVLDEGGDIMDGFFPGVGAPCAMVGIGEKGAANLEFVAKSAGGHASVPTRDNPLPRLCRAWQKSRGARFPSGRTPPLSVWWIPWADTAGFPPGCSLRTGIFSAPCTSAGYGKPAA